MFGMSKKEIGLYLIITIVLGLALWAIDQFGGVSDRPTFAQTSLTITHTNGAKTTFDAEIARTPDEQSYGLMFVKSLPANASMIFPYTPPREVAFWMKNTLIPLDMLFVRPDGIIGRIVTEAQPLDVTPIPSQIPVSAVIEINGGEAKKDGIEVGDKVSTEVIHVTP